MKNNVARRILETAGVEPSELLLDLAHLAMSVYAADLRIPRRYSADQWSRDFTLYLPVRDVERWNGAAAALKQTLDFLTGDQWTIVFRARPARPPSPPRQLRLPTLEEVCLFSGGLDSLVGAIDRLHAGRRLALVGHHGAGITNDIQERVLENLDRHFPEQATPFMFWVQPPKLEKKGADSEPTMRSRSLLFLALGLVVANTATLDAPLVVAENGTISLNVPLTPARSGSLSTRTTHPYFFALFRQFIAALGIPTQIQLPYRFKTKGEMLRESVNQEALRNIAPMTMSCSHPESGRYRGKDSRKHCGYCVPCIIRRASMDAAGLEDASYNVNIRTRPPKAESESGRDIRAFKMAVARLNGASNRQTLLDVLSTGPLPPEEASEYASVYRRGMEEVGAFLD
ncbi:MAG: hypothetical protein KJZ54_02095 [Phycisphaerales bacterium]|nr:hypothetical protein [Phycisphaerales bacterium]